MTPKNDETSLDCSNKQYIKSFYSVESLNLILKCPKAIL